MKDYGAIRFVNPGLHHQGAGCNPLFDVLMTLHLPAKPYKSNFNKDFPLFDWVINGFEQEEKLVFIFQYRVKLFKKETIEMIIRHFKEVVSAVLDNPDIRLKDINISNDLLSMKSTSLQEEEGDFGF